MDKKELLLCVSTGLGQLWEKQQSWCVADELLIYLPIDSCGQVQLEEAQQ
jgi:hypothetical protein